MNTCPFEKQQIFKLSLTNRVVDPSPICIEYCESFWKGNGCAFIKTCPAYQQEKEEQETLKQLNKKD